MEEMQLDGRPLPPKKDPRTIARKYQLELCEKAVKENIIVCLGTGCGKTHIAVLLMNELKDQFIKPKKEICVFLAPTVPLVRQQAVVIENSIDLKVQSYFGNVKHLKTHADWENDLIKYEVFVMTPIIFLQSLRHCHIRMEIVALLIFDECHHAQLNTRHGYTQIMKLFYNTDNPKRPRVFGMTASPIYGKGGSKQLEYGKYINSLEKILHSRICVVDGNLELEALAASPEISIYYYTPVNIYDSKFISVYKEELVANKNNLLSILRDNCTDLNVLKKKLKLLSKVHGDVIFCLESVGLWGAVQASRILLSDAEYSIIDGMKEYLNKASSCPNCDFLSDNLDTVAFPIKALEETFLSKKCSVLIEILQEYRERPRVKCIIFAKRIIVVKSLAFIISKIKLLEFWSCDYLVGVNSGSTSRHKMNTTVERFRSGEINLLVATNVAEEGLDIPTCCLIIRFDLPETVCSFVQSRGRARSLESKYAFLVERDNEQEQKLIHNFLNKEVNIKKEIKRRTSNEILDCLQEKIYRVEATGASISTGCSIMLLHRYCSKLPHDKYYYPVPKFFYMDVSKGTVCRIILPSNSPVRQVDSSPCSSKEEAKRFACFNACVQLHNIGALTNYLLPETLGARKKLEAVKSKSKSEKDDLLNKEIYEAQIPEAFTTSFLKSKNSFILYFYFIKFTPFPEDREYRKFGIFLKTSLPKDAEAMEVDLHLSHGRFVKAALVSCGTLTFTEDEIELSRNFQEMFLNIIFNRMDFDCDFYMLGISESNCVPSSTFYLLLPLFGDDYTENVNVDWKTVKMCLSSPIFSNPEKSICTIFPYSDSSETLRMADGLFHTTDILNSLVFSPCTKVFYFVVDILPNRNGYSKMNGSKHLSHYDFYKNKHNIILSHPTQALLKAKRLFVARNLLINRLLSNKEASELDEHFIELVPEVCNLKIIGFSKDIGSSLSLLPSFVHRLENLLVAIQLKTTMLTTMPECSQVTSSRVLEAITTAKCLERFSLERLEILGDAFLKYVVSRHNFISYEALDEGQLTMKRSEIINNLHLCNLAINKKLQEYIHDELFDPETFYAPGRRCRITCNNENLCNEDVQESVLIKCNKGHRFLHKKTIADVVEALIGAFLADCGFNAAIAFLRWIGIEVSFEIKNVQRIFDESRLYISMIDKIEITSIENLLGYSFRHKGLLLQACIHPSYTRHSGGCYQRLEFLGDAVLDYLIISYLYSSYPELKPGHLSDLRSMIVSNDSFGRIAVHKGFHKYLLSCAESLNKAIKKFEKHLFENNSRKDMIDSFCPKVLGDLIESCIGAILLDSGFDLNHVWAIMINLLEQALGLNHLANFRMNPIRELQELCQSCHLKLIFSRPVEENHEFLVKIEISSEKHQLIHHEKNKNSKTARKIASQELLCKLEAHGLIHKCKSMALMLVKTRKEKAKLIGFDEKPVATDVDINEFIQFDKLCLNDREIISTDHFTIEGSDEIKMNAKSQLYSICSTNYWNVPLFVCHKVEGPSHLTMFTYKAILEIPINPNIIVECYSEPQRRKKAAQEHAAEGVIWYLKQLGYII